MYARIVFVFGVSSIVHQAMRAARADLAAAALLTALPRRIDDVLDARSRALRWLLIPVSLVLIACSSAYLARSEWVLLSRAVLLLSALYVAATGATAIAYLCAGLGTASAHPDHIHAGQIWFVPLLTVAVASDLRAASVAWLATYAMSWAARRAAIMTMRDGLEPPDTDPAPVWRALIAGSLFCSIQALAHAQLLWFGASHRYAFAIASALAAGWLIRASRVGDKRMLHWAPTQASVWLIGMACGVISGLIALAVHRTLYPSQMAAPLLSTGEWVVSFIALALLAPLAEERFFRGWLQNAIATELPAASRPWAFAITAIVFALFHLDSDVVPQLILGLVAGALFAFGGGLGPAVVAHCAHNLIVLLAAAQLH